MGFEYRLLAIPISAAAVGLAWLEYRASYLQVANVICDFLNRDWAGWAQAVGTVAAILGTYHLAQRGYERERSAKEIEQLKLLKNQARSVARSIDESMRAASLVRQMRQELFYVSPQKTPNLKSLQPWARKETPTLSEAIQEQLTIIRLPPTIGDPFRECVLFSPEAFRSLIQYTNQAADIAQFIDSGLYERTVDSFWPLGQDLHHRLILFVDGKFDKKISTELAPAKHELR